MNIHARGADPHEPLDAVLRAASVPGHPEELAGERAALAAFRAAAPASRRRSLLARVLTVKVLVIGGVTLSTGTVLAVAGGVFMPILRNDPGPTTPADVPAVIRTSEPAVSPPAGPSSATTEARTRESTTQSAPPGACDDCRDREGKRDKPDGDGRPGRGKDGKGGQPPSTETSEPADDTTESSSRTQTPDSPAHGAVTAVPPSGAEPPSPGD